MALSKQQIEQIKALGARPAQVQTQRILSIGTQGHQRKGKTDFCLRTTPGPILFLNLDEGSEDIEDKAKKEWGRDDIFVVDLKTTPTQDEAAMIEDARVLWSRAFTAVEGACKNSLVRTIAADTCDQLWAILRLAMLGKLKGVPQSEYQIVNPMMEAFLKMPRNHGIHFIGTHRVDEIWEEQEYVSNGQTKKRRAPTGKFKRDGFKHTEYIFRVNIEHLSRPKFSKSGTQVGVEFGLKVLDCTANANLAGTELWGEDCTFPMLGVSVYESSDLEDWQ